MVVGQPLPQSFDHNLLPSKDDSVSTGAMFEGQISHMILKEFPVRLANQIIEPH